MRLEKARKQQMIQRTSDQLQRERLREREEAEIVKEESRRIKMKLKASKE